MKVQQAVQSPNVGPTGNKFIILGFFRRNLAMKRICEACQAWFAEAQALPRGEAPERLLRWTEFKWVDRYV